ncbi:type II toxin-antitoxin system RelE/ParE family toxin [Halobacterium sp. CBA1126]|uniref:type II toxin-antitoxin system RelE family toxin n=1 Tax=Halobacterium TaxID=2239 RepID=UPI0012F8811F|nr:type II toxin-antitoxin system RelE/ParE family toxin [Halobacterium sp. CBA1126]MUV59291.1 type II toxin-antitoxin system RelE/ParE family toxin [Halobacterium sp. CBA1126]
MSDDWDWELTKTADRQFASLEAYAQERIASKLDEVVDDPWRDPFDYLEPLQGAPHQKLRVGPFRLGCRADRSSQTLYVLRVRKRGGDAYRSDDD